MASDKAQATWTKLQALNEAQQSKLLRTLYGSMEWDDNFIVQVEKAINYAVVA